MSEKGRVRAGFSHYLFDLIVIVSGITISFVLNEWRQDRQGQEMMKRDLAAIRTNLTSDRKELTELIKARENTLSAMRTLVRYSLGDDTPMDPAEQVGELSHAGFSFFPDTGAWKAMVASGNLRWIDDLTLQGALSRYYDHAVPRVLDNNRILDSLIVKGLHAFLGGEHPGFEDGEGFAHEVPLSFIRTEPFRRNVGSVIPHTGWYGELLQMTLEQLDAALKAVEGSLSAAELGAR